MKRRAWAALVAVFSLFSIAPVVAQPIAPSPQGISAVSSGITVCAAGNCAVWTGIQSTPSVTAQITGTMTSLTLTFEATTDGQSWAAVNVVNAGSGAVGTTTTAVGQFAFINTGFIGFRVRCTTYASGGANVSLTRGLASSTAKFTPGFPSFTAGDLLYASSPTAIGGIADVALGQVLQSGGVGVAPAYTASPSVTGAITSTRSAIGVTSTDGLVLANATAAANGAQQWSPRLRLAGFGWGTGLGTSQAVDCAMENQITQGSVPTINLTWKCSTAGGAYSDLMNLLTSAAGVPSLFMGSGGSVQAGSTGRIGWNGRAALFSSADGVVNLTNNAANGFTALSMNGDIIYSYAVPTITSGFSTTTPTIAGRASAFAVTIAATPGVTGTVAFNATFTNVPSCSCSNTVTANLVQCVPTTTTAVLNGVWVANDVIRCLVLGY